MKRLGMWLLLALSALAMTGCAGEGIYGGTLIADGQHVASSGQGVYGDLLIIGGSVTLERDARLGGSLYILGGAVAVDGEVGGDVSLVSGRLDLGPEARIQGDLNVGGGTLNRAAEATVAGKVETGTGIQVPSAPAAPFESALGRGVRSLLGALLPATLAYLLARFLPRPLARVADAGVNHPLVSAAMGVLAGVVGLSLLVLMVFTIILIPITLLGLLLFGFLVVYGWGALGLRIGRRLARRLSWDLGPAGAAFVGTAILMIVVDLLSFVPLVGGLAGILSVAVGFGAVMLTRLGLRTFVPATESESVLEGGT